MFNNKLAIISSVCIHDDNKITNNKSGRYRLHRDETLGKSLDYHK